MRIHTYLDLDKIREYCNGRYVVIFGAGAIGGGWAYDILRSAGICVDAYADNNLPINYEVRNGIKVNSIDRLAHYNKIVVFLATGYKFQSEIMDQLNSYGISDIYIIDELFLTELIQSIASTNNEGVLKQYESIIDDKVFSANMYYRYTGKILDFDNPCGFNEKIQYLKLNDRNPFYTSLVDKVAVKEYASRIVGDDCIIPTIGIWDRYEDIDFEKLPEAFVIKCSHDSGSTKLIKCKKAINHSEYQEYYNNRLKINLYYATREWPYKKVIPKILIEPMLVENSECVRDYKFFCYAGKAEYFFVVTDREKGHKKMRIDFFDRKLNHLNCQHALYPNSELTPELPENISQMIEMAEKLAEKISFVRIDLYSVSGHIYFGEYTFYPGAGVEPYPEILGQKLVING